MREISFIVEDCPEVIRQHGEPTPSLRVKSGEHISWGVIKHFCDAPYYLARHSSIPKETVSNYFGEIPETPYKVTYKIDQNGKYLVNVHGLTQPVLIDRDTYLTRGAVSICLIPLDWHGQRVNREAISINREE
jgi:hypothetical protein